MIGRGYTVESRRERQAAERARDVDFTRVEMPLEEAEQTVVDVGKGRNTLGWVARERPEHLERLMDEVPPNTQLGVAVAAVYNGHLEEVATAISHRNGINQVRTLARLAERHSNGGSLPRVQISRAEARAYFT